jgi:pimeloyl-ACP methyl ester carboxylesterase
MTQAVEPTIQQVGFGLSQVRVRIEGVGPPLLLLMGIGGHLDMWQPLTEYLPGRRLVMFDFPGTGESSLPWFPPTMANCALFVSGLMRKLELSQADILGYSWGGMLAQQLAAQHPGIVRKLVLACTTPGVLGVPAHPQVWARLLTPLRYYSPGYMAAIAADTFGGKFRRDPALVRAEVARRMANPPSWPGYAFQVIAASTFSTFPLAPLIRQPTLILAGDDDPVVKTQNQRLLHNLLRQSELRILENSGHLLLLDSPQTAARIVTSFLEKKEG